MNAKNQTFHEFLTQHCNDTLENHESAIEILFDHYSESNHGDNPKIHAGLAKLREQLVSADTETIMNTVFELCTLHEECGFRGGLNMGVTLAMELASRK